MTKAYLTPRSFEAALKNQAKIVAHEHGVNAGMVMRAFYFHRLSARIFASDPDGWMLKGGQALLIRYPGQARLSRDLDILRSVHRDLDEAISALLAAAAEDTGDFLRFSPLRLDRHTDEIGGAKQTFEVFLGTRRIDVISVDIVVGRRPTRPAERVAFQPALALPWPTDWPDILLYPTPDHVADKICAMYEWHHQAPSTRFRDLADLLLISQNEVLDGAEVVAALASERIRRLALGIDLRLPSSFAVPGPSWVAGYPKAMADLGGLRGCQTLPEAEVAADLFLTPVLAGTADGYWAPDRAQWIASRDGRTTGN